jgi:hypothetical protein
MRLGKNQLDKERALQEVFEWGKVKNPELLNIRGMFSCGKNVKFEFKDGCKISCEPFFYGIGGHRTLIRSTKIGELTEQILERNAYELMFLRRCPEWLV